jgi:predicted nucleic acid-binding protein
VSGAVTGRFSTPEGALVDDTLARQAVDVAAQYHLRGGDAVYVAVALRFGSTLITLDRQQRERAQHALTARHPAEELVETARAHE